MNISVAIELAVAILTGVARARLEDRDELTQEEWARIMRRDDAERAELVKAIEKAREEGR